MKNKIEDLRNHLFETIEALKDPDKPMDLDRAGSIAAVARVIVDSAKVEVDMVKAVGAAAGSGFLPVSAMPPRGPQRPVLAAGDAAVPRTPEATPPRSCTTCRGRTAQDPCHLCGAAWQRSA